tara:strand:+ start:616 stop:1059 length:444 start_codon:yes stop_codon:yes gene_type:complete
MQDIDNLISDCINQINEKINGINFLEKIKFSLIDKMKSIDLLNFENINNKEQYINNANINLLTKIEKANENVSKIKKTIDNDNLTIILEGLKTISIHEKLISKSVNQQYLSKYVGMVLAKNTIIDEIITKDTILLNISIVDRTESAD